MKVEIYSWHGNPSVIAPYKQNEVVEIDVFTLAKEFLDKNKVISIRRSKYPGSDFTLFVSDTDFVVR